MNVRIPFHAGIFFYAMIGLTGREPDTKSQNGMGGNYEYMYVPKNAKERAHFQDCAVTLSTWLDQFDITFSGSRCEFGKPTPLQSGGKDVLQIRISHPVSEK